MYAEESKKERLKKVKGNMRGPFDKLNDRRGKRKEEHFDKLSDQKEKGKRERQTKFLTPISI